jgi:hypothetical protein
MKSSTPLKIFTIFLFVLLIVVFIVFRTGAFTGGKPLAATTADTNGLSAILKRDTIPASFRDSVLREYRNMRMMSGSKSAPVIPPADHPSMKKLVESLWIRSLIDTGRKRTIFYGTKSAPVVPQKKQ